MNFRKAIKDAKWWMFIPFACLSFKMSSWTLTPDDIDDRYGRDMVQNLNLMITILVTGVLLALFQLLLL